MRVDSRNPFRSMSDPDTARDTDCSSPSIDFNRSAHDPARPREPRPSSAWNSPVRRVRRGCVAPFSQYLEGEIDHTMDRTMTCHRDHGCGAATVQAEGLRGDGPDGPDAGGDRDPTDDRPRCAERSLEL